VDLPTHKTSTFLGILKYSTVCVNTKLFGGIRIESALTDINPLGSKSFGSTIDEFILVNILNSSAHRTSYPKLDNPYEITGSGWTE
jgi:hypothetical protein